jgi:hypothetical protein
MEASTQPSTHRKGETMLQDNPALGRTGWLPIGPWPELDELHDEHEERLRHHAEAADEFAKLYEQFKEEDAAQVSAAKEGGEAPQLTPQAEREDALRAAKAKAKAEREALAKFIVRAVETIEAHEAEWLADLEEQGREAVNKRLEAARLLAEADQVVGEAKRTTMWLRRTAYGGIRPPLGHIAHSQPLSWVWTPLALQRATQAGPPSPSAPE